MIEYSYCYQITLEDITGTFPYSKILQSDYSQSPRSRQLFLVFKRKVDKYCSQYPKINLKELQKLVVDEARTIRKEYPDCFSAAMGWYDLKCLVSTDDGLRILEEIEQEYSMEKLKKEAEQAYKVLLEVNRVELNNYNYYLKTSPIHLTQSQRIWSQLYKAIAQGRKARLAPIH